MMSSYTLFVPGFDSLGYGVGVLLLDASFFSHFVVDWAISSVLGLGRAVASV